MGTLQQGLQSLKQDLKNELNIEVKDTQPVEESIIMPSPEQVPMMYRAQVSGRCSLQYGKNQKDLDRWTEEWVYPNKKDEPSYQFKKPQLALDDGVYRFEIEFPWRVFSNCGQDSIFRPVIGKDGIPFIPGSGIKGLFRRLLEWADISDDDKRTIQNYCGTADKPATLRFLRAYPLGDWAQTKRVTPRNKNEEIRYQMVDICHPQQKKQVEGGGRPQAIALISFYKPTFVFELSSIKPLGLTEWQHIEQLLRKALNQGIGGKTSNGYGLYNAPQDKNLYPLAFHLFAKGVSPLLRNDEPEFRPNLFKATLRGHVSRLLGGATNNVDTVKIKVNQLFGDNSPGSLQLYWETLPQFLTMGTYGRENTPIYENQGILYLDVKKNNNNQDIAFLQKVMEFAFIMGGFGKSWRRVYHPDFMNYNTRAIGCHWWGSWQKPDQPLNINNPQQLTQFLNGLFNTCQQYLNINNNQQYINNWRESWHPQNVKVFSKVVAKSELITLFHEDKFKYTPAIGGKNKGDKRPKYVSCVWHRMLPIENNQYLEIMTVFRGDNQLWNGQKANFEKEITERNFGLTWGN